MTYASTAERLADVIDRLEAGGTYQQERESLFDIYAGLDDLGAARQLRTDEVGRRVARMAETLVDEPGYGSLVLDTEAGRLTLELQAR
jgi:hypothetical protein